MLFFNLKSFKDNLIFHRGPRTTTTLVIEVKSTWIWASTVSMNFRDIGEGEAEGEAAILDIWIRSSEVWNQQFPNSSQCLRTITQRESQSRSTIKLHADGKTFSNLIRGSKSK